MSSNSTQDEKKLHTPKEQAGVEIFPPNYPEINLRQTYASLNLREDESDTDSDPLSSEPGKFRRLGVYLNHLSDTESFLIEEHILSDSKEVQLEYDVAYMVFNLRDFRMGDEIIHIFSLFAQFPKFNLFEDCLSAFVQTLKMNTDAYHKYGFLIRMIEHALDSSIVLGEYDADLIEAFVFIEDDPVLLDLAIAQILFSLLRSMCAILFPNLPDHLAHFNFGAVDTKIDHPSKMITLFTLGGTRSPFFNKEGAAQNTLLPGQSIFNYNFIKYMMPEQILSPEGLKYMSSATALKVLYYDGLQEPSVWKKTMQFPKTQPRFWWTLDNVLVRRDRLPKTHPCYMDFPSLQACSTELMLPDECPPLDFDALGNAYCALPECTVRIGDTMKEKLPKFVNSFLKDLPDMSFFSIRSLFSFAVLTNLLVWLYSPLATGVSIVCTTFGVMAFLSLNDWVLFSLVFAYALSCSRVVKKWWRMRVLKKTNACFEAAAKSLDDKLGFRVFTTAYGYIQAICGTIYAPVLLIAIVLWLIYMFVVRPKREKQTNGIVLQAKNNPKLSTAIDYLFIAFVSLTTFCGVYEMSNMKGVVDTACKMSSFHNLVSKVTKLVGSDDMSLPPISKFSIRVRSDAKHILSLRSKIEKQTVSQQLGIDEDLIRTQSKALFEFFKQKKFVLKKVLGTQTFNTDEWLRPVLAFNTFTVEHPIKMSFILRYKNAEEEYKTITVEQVRENYARLGFVPELIQLITRQNLIIVNEKPSKEQYTRKTRDAYLYEISTNYFEYKTNRETFIPPENLCAMPTVQGFVNHFIHKYGAAFALFTIGFVLAYVFYKLVYPWLRNQFCGEKPVLEGNMTKAGFPKPRKVIEVDKWTKTKGKYNALREAIGLTPVEELEDKVAAAYLEKHKKRDEQKLKPLPPPPVIKESTTSIPEIKLVNEGREDPFGGKSWYDIMREEEQGLGTTDYSDEHQVDPFTETEEQRERRELERDDARDGEYYERQQMERALKEFRDNNDVSQEVKKRRVKVSQGTITYNSFDQISGPKGLINEAKPLGPQVRPGDFVEYRIGLATHKGVLKQITKRGFLIKSGDEPAKWMRPKQVKVVKKVRPEAKCPNSEPWVDALADHSYFLHDTTGALVGSFAVVSGAIITAGHVVSLLVHGDMQKPLNLKGGTKIRCQYTTFRNPGEMYPLLVDFLYGINDAKNGADWALLEPLSAKYEGQTYKMPSLVSTNIMSEENYNPEKTYSVQVYGVTEKGVRCPYPGTVIGKVAKYTSYPGSSGTGVYDSITQNLLGVHIGNDQEIGANIYQPISKHRKFIAALLAVYRSKNGLSPSPH